MGYSGTILFLGHHTRNMRIQQLKIVLTLKAVMPSIFLESCSTNLLGLVNSHHPSLKYAAEPCSSSFMVNNTLKF
jgi:hypothetical protein